MKILHRDFDIAVSKIKGFEKLENNLARDVDTCKLIRFIVLLDETQYTVNSDGSPEMTQEAQKEYDEFTSNIRRALMCHEKINILDEGYGMDVDELEWHITGYVMNAEGIIGIMEIDTYVRTDDPDESV